MTRIDDLLQEIRAFKERQGLSNAALAKLARLHANTLRDLDKPDWSPTTATVRNIEKAMRGEPIAKPRRRRRA